MVQRKVPNKLGIQANHVKAEKRLGNLKASSCQHQDGQNRGSDMKKKMKRSRSIKLSDIENLNSSPLRKTASQPGKPPPLNSPTTAATPQKQTMIKTTGGSPNYMKATSSSEARKERSQVSSFSTPTHSDSKNLRRRNLSNSKLSSGSGDKATRSLTRSSSLKKIRTLTKTPSFKPVRSAAKKCSRVAIYADVNVQKATCSSTLKDSKFPPYLELSPGATEAEGTSILKVCPYTYCSLNGHHHTPLPPLKSFLKAKRQSMKAQKSTKVEVPSPRRVEPSGDETEEIYDELLISSADISPQYDSDSTKSTNVPLVKEAGEVFFIEIYAKKLAGSIEAMEKHAEDDQEIIVSSGEHRDKDNESCTHGGGNEAAAEQENQRSDAQNVAAGKLSQLETGYTSMDEDDNTSEGSDMEWEEGQFSTPESDYSSTPDKEYCINECLSERKQIDYPDELNVTISDHMISNCTEEILADEVLQELFEEETASSDTQSQHCDSEMEGMLEIWGILRPAHFDVDSTYEQLSFAGDAFEEPPTVEEKSEEAGKDLNGVANALASMEEQIAESPETNENIEVSKTHHDIFEKIFQLGDAENDCSASMTTEYWNDDQENKSPHDDEEIELLQSQIIDSSQVSDEEKKVETNEACECDKIVEEISSSQEQIIDEACECDKIAEEISSSQEKIIEPASQHENVDVVVNQSLLEEDQDGANKHRSLAVMNLEEQNNARISKTSSAENDAKTGKMKKEGSQELDTAETIPVADKGTCPPSGSRYLRRGKNSRQELDNICNMKWTIQPRKAIIDSGEEREFNPREPNFLPVVPDPEAEKVDLKHQSMDERKNSEEWMIDYALQQAVTKLAPARKRKVALLVEAFEAVLPVPKYQNHIRNTSAAFSHSRPIQACS